MAKTTLQEKLSSDKDFLELTATRDQLANSVRELRRSLGHDEDSYTFSITACGAAFAAAITCFSFGAASPALLVLGTLAMAGAAYSGYQAYKVHSELDDLREATDRIQSQYEQARDAVRDYAFSNIKTNGVSEPTPAEPAPALATAQMPPAPAVTAAPDKAAAASGTWQHKMALEQIAESMATRH